MKINYKNTALGFGENPAKFLFYLAEDSKNMSEPERIAFGQSLRQAFKESQLPELMNKNIRYVTEPFWIAFQKSKDKLRTLILKEEINDVGILIISGQPFTLTIYYAVLINIVEGEEVKYRIIFNQFSKHSKNDFINLDISITETEDSSKEFIWSGFTKQGLTKEVWVSEIVLFLLFLKYCEIETKVIKAEKKDHHIGVKYVNETKSDITVLDSTWFTTIVRSEGFGVRGHLRWQPHGPGLSQRRLQYIAAFEKEGYTRTAKVLRNT